MLARFGLLLVVSCLIVDLAGCGGSSTPPPGVGSLTAEIEDAQRKTNPEQRARDLTTVGYKQFLGEDRLGAEKTLIMAGEACKEVKDPASRAGVYIYLADAQARSGARSDSGRSLDSARKAIGEVKDAEVRGSRLAEVAVVEANHLKQTEEAKKTFAQAAALAETISEPEGKATVLLATANAYLKAKMETEAGETLNAALEVAKTLPDDRKRSTAIAAVADVQTKFSKPEIAQATYDQAVEVAKNVTPDFSKAFALADLAEKMLAAKMPDKAKAALEEAAVTVKKIKEQDLMGQAEARVDAVKAKLPMM